MTKNTIVFCRYCGWQAENVGVSGVCPSCRGGRLDLVYFAEDERADALKIVAEALKGEAACNIS